jgi:hypothetical protein
MKQATLFIFFVGMSLFSRTQNIESLLAAPQTIELSISTSQPRLQEIFQISLAIYHLRANIFKSLFGKIQPSTDVNTADNSEMTMNVYAIAKGKNGIGPLVFYLDKTKYTTNKVTYEVIDPLPPVDKGIWFRKVKTSDSTFCIIIEQRIPAVSKTTKKSDNTTSFTTEPEYPEIAKFKDGYSIRGLSGGTSHSNTNFSSVVINGEERQFMYGYSVYYFTIVDPKAAIRITKDQFQDLPASYKFQDIVIQ